MGSKKSVTPKAVVNNPVPDAFKSTIKVSEDALTTFLTFSVPRWYECVVREKIQGKEARVSTTIDTAKIFGDTRMRPIFDRGLKKQLIDGARSSEQVKGSDGVVVKRNFSFEEAHADAVATMERNIEWLYGLRDKSEYGTSDPILGSAIDALIVWVVKNCTDEEGKRYTKSRPPKAIKSVGSLDDFRTIASQFGATEKRTERIITNATNIHADDDEDLDVTP